MKSQIKLLIAAATVSSVIASACTGSNEKSADTAATRQRDIETCTDIKGQWDLVNIVFSDSDYVRPSGEVPGSRQYITFEDSTYFIQTNCNTFFGSYTIKGDSITLGDGAMTEMACDNMVTEDAIRRILPNITTVYIENDSIARLDSRKPSEYIVLRKATVRK